MSYEINKQKKEHNKYTVRHALSCCRLSSILKIIIIGISASLFLKSYTIGAIGTI